VNFAPPMLRGTKGKRMELDLQEAYACAQSRRKQGAPCAFAVVTRADFASVQGAIDEHNVEPITYDSGLCVFEFLDLASAARLRDDLLQTRAAIVQLFWIDGDPSRCIGPSRGVPTSRGFAVAGAPTLARLVDDHTPCEHCR
jgi:hypothetical protein